MTFSLSDSKIFIFCGEYGSGKTQVALNYSKFLAKAYGKSYLVDLDIVNPFFRSRDSAEDLRKKGVEVIFNQRYLYADLPALPPEVIGCFTSDKPVVIDVGGDDGAIVLGRYYHHLQKAGFEFWMVINEKRPFTSTVEGIKAIKERIERKSRLKVTGFINNTNLGELTEVEDILKGQELVQKAAEELNLKVVFTAAKKELVEDIKEKINTKVFPIEIDYKLPWL
ncbi:hypothetical protein SAMN02745227_00370 [Anaerobranca californiensis DSM 14826]|jgi:MinD-like ATPase involved in chromosome partitioning or flagellar assembly|uniref:CobQ/CobB/MinD/ParA nucleotide binding domain-containing protein n=1 Tax=Anaerobranca californiensis DSM 14826 TaxID=1120989 RepID=A0A1M6L4W0_9FIRM|nr:hypothetical protein [Anaerobranca californiensis]SHJ66226.1 hypothetical protein SAMN02745227_00370 [Anaerobranca californiensis DSM 14826]